ncbi:MAG: phage portal protein, partial [Actinomycetota bacterium]|nr:phage portal protein [Actinomycetota bacterium]
MALSRRDAVDAAENIMAGPRLAERRRLDRIARAVNPSSFATSTGDFPLSVEIPAGAPLVMANLAQKSRTNYLPLILDVLSQTLIVEGYRAPRTSDNAPAWAGWQANGMDARQSGLHRNALQYGIAYGTVLPGDSGPVVRGVSPRKMTALYQDAVEDEWPMLALREYDDAVRLYDEEGVYFLGKSSPIVTSARLEYIDFRPHNLGVCPVVRYRDQMLLDEGDQVGVVEPLIEIQRRHDETTFGMMIAQYFSAFRQRYVIGWVPTSEQEQLKASAAEFWAFDDPDVKVGEFEGTDPQRYINSKDAAIRDMGAISQVPPQQLAIGNGLSNLSAESLASLEAGKDRKVRSVETSLGESHEQTLRLYEYAAGERDTLDNDQASIRWADATARSLAQTADALGKMVTMLGVPQEAAWEELPEMNDDKLARWKQLRLEDSGADPIASLASTLNQQAQGLPTTTA